jgi:hypothetical protein
MHPAVTCPGCSRKLRLPAADSDAVARCPLCHFEFDARAFTTGAPEQRPAPRAEAPPSRRAAPSEPVSVRKPVGAVKWLMLLPAGIPLLVYLSGDAVAGFGVIGWGVVAALAAAACGFFVLVTRWPQWMRGLCGAVAVLVGYLALGYGALYDRVQAERPTVTAREWRTVSSRSGSYEVKMPGQPSATTNRHHFELMSETMSWRTVKHERSRMTFKAGVGELKPRWQRIAKTTAGQLDLAPDFLRLGDEERVWGQWRKGLQLGPDRPGRLPGSLVREGSYAGPPREEGHLAARFEACQGWLLILAVISERRITLDSPEVRAFFDSARLTAVEP